MKNTFLFLSASLVFFAAKSQTTNSFISSIDIPQLEQKAQGAKAKSLLSGAANTYDIKYHRCDWIVDPAVNYIEGTVTTYFKPTVSNLNQMEFDLVNSFAIDSIIYHTATVSYNQLTSDLLTINLPTILPVNQLDSITVHYQGIPAGSGFGSFIQTTHGPSNTPIIWTLSEPFGARDWWPSKQNLNDKIDSIDVYVTTPQAYRVAGNGLLKSEITNGASKTYHWKSNYPIAAYLIAIAVTDYAVYSDFVPTTNGNLEVLNYVYPEDLTLAQSLTPDIINVIKLFDSLTIAYPFSNEKYGHAQFSWGGGMEHQTMSFVINFNHALIAHECAHQWFGDHVTCGSWQDIWLNEGFATYFEGLTEERYFPSTWMGWKQSKISSVTSQPDGSVLCDDTTSVNRIFSSRLSYNKGSYLLHMLRWKLGDSLFFLGIKNYLNDPTLAGGYAKTPDLKAHFEAVSAQNLTIFFNQWYYNQGYPSYQISYTQNGSAVDVTVNQTQSHSSVSFFEMPIPIKFIGASTDTTIIFDHQFSGQNFSTTINFPIISTQFDPELWILSANNLVIGVSDLKDQNTQLSVYPNPAETKLNIILHSLNNGRFQYEITDITGRVISIENEYSFTANSLNTIDISDFSPGVFFIKVQDNNTTYTKRFIKK